MSQFELIDRINMYKQTSDGLIDVNKTFTYLEPALIVLFYQVKYDRSNYVK